MNLAHIILPDRKEGPLAILSLAADDSHDKNNKRLIVAGGYVGWPVAFFEATCNWEKTLISHKLNYFRASECEMLMGEFHPSRSNDNLSAARAKAEAARYDFIQIIDNAELSGIYVGLVLSDFHELLQSNSLAGRWYSEGPEIVTYRRLIKSTIEMVREDYPALADTVIAFTFDEHTNYRQAEEAYRWLKETDPDCARVMGYVGHASDKDFIPLQMGDLLAHEARHFTQARLDGKTDERPTFALLKQSCAYGAVMQKKHLAEALDKMPRDL